MRTAFTLALRNLLGAGLRTWLSVLVLSFSFVIIIWLKGIMTGWDHQAKKDMTEWQIGGGQYWQAAYDPYDPLSLGDSHAPIPDEFAGEVQQGDMVPQLLAQGSLYPEGRLQQVIIRGIAPNQSLFQLPTSCLDSGVQAIPAMIGYLMAHNMGLEKGDIVTLRWRDKRGTFDATDLEICEIFTSTVPAIDQGQVYLSLERLREMMSLPGEATILSFRDPDRERAAVEGWVLKTKSVLTKQVDDVIKAKSTGQSIIYLILLLLAMLAIFDTQVLSIFRRQREIGTYIALGYTRQEVVGLFTVEGSMHAVLAALLATAYGLPFLAWQARAGWTMPVDVSEFGMSIAQTLYPIYTIGLILSTIMLVFITTIIVSYLPARKIAKMNPTEALRGKLQ